MSTQRWIEDVFRPVIVGLMVGSIVLALVQMLHLVIPAWDGTYLAVFCGLVAAESYFSYRFAPKGSWDTVTKLRYRGSEALLIILLLQLSTNISEGRANIFEGLPRFDAPMLIAMTIVLLCWFFAADTAADLERVGEPPEQTPAYVPPLDTLTSRFLVGGAILLIATGLSKIRLEGLFDLGRAPIGGLVLHVLVYFLLGVILLGQVRYTELSRRWEARGTRMAPELPAGWVRYSVIFVALVALLAFVLPTSYTVGLLDVLRTILGWIVAIVTTIALLIMTGLSLLASAILSLFGVKTQPMQFQPAPPPPPIQVPPGGDDGGAWLEFAKSALFWVAVIAVLVYLVRSYWQSGPRLRQILAAFAPLQRVLQWWAGVWRGVRRSLAVVGEQIGRLLPARSAPAAGSPLGRLLRVRGLSPREQVLYYYLSIVRRAGRQGYPRHGTQSPREYSAGLAPQLPQAQEDLDRLTQEFIEARYSRHPIEPPEANQAQTHWQQVKAALQRARDQVTGAKPPPGPGPSGGTGVS
ncbi:MAG TPA: DUF4129 domain-containing protein [Chloroflexia bacterium]|jgi:hypothetical protein|nr:DUF4129 domain-containing protein [Chloroflexia bacterium]